MAAQTPAEVTRQSEKPFACPTCKNAFTNKSDLARHGKWYVYAAQSHLLTSTERIHTGVRPHVCDFEGCGKCCDLELDQH